MRSSHVVPALAALTAGVTAAVALHRRAERRLSAPTATAVPSASAPSTPVAPVPAHDGVVLPFVRPVPVAPASEQPAVPARCGDNGGRTKAGAPCGARATAGGRCHHHPMAA